MVSESLRLTGITHSIRSPTSRSLPPCTAQRRDERSAAAMKNAHASGTSSRNTPAGMMASRYFSAYSTQRITRKYSEKSASFSAMGVAVSPGMAEMPAEVTVAVAVRRRTVAVFSSMEAVHSFTAPS